MFEELGSQNNEMGAIFERSRQICKNNLKELATNAEQSISDCDFEKFIDNYHQIQLLQLELTKFGI